MLTEQEKENLSKYLRAPDHGQVVDFIKSLGVSSAQFGRFYGVPLDTIKSVACGRRLLPVRHWHIVYEKIKPAYGAGFLNKGAITIKSKPDIVYKKKRANYVSKKPTNTKLDFLK